MIVHPCQLPSPPESVTAASVFLHLHQYFPCTKYLAVTNTRNGYEKRKCRILCSLEELNINQYYCHDVKHVKREDVQKIRIQNIGRHFTLLMVKKTWSN